MCWYECRVVWQMNGATPLLIASRKGRLDCVRALLDGGAAINQADVSSTSSMARHRGGCVRVPPGSLRACVSLQLVGCAGMARVGECGREMI
jgi:hypothetical protein